MNTILIADDHPVVAEGLRCLLVKNGHNIKVVCTNGVEAYHKILTTKPSIAVLDMNMPGMNAIEIIEKLQGQRIQTKFIIYTISNDIGTLNRAKELGVKGYLLKEFALSEVETCIQTIRTGQEYFSPLLIEKMMINNNNGVEDIDVLLTFAERKILGLVAEQKSTKQIAEQLFVTEKTVETHRRNIIRKLGIPVGNNSLVLWATKNLNQ